MMKTFLERVRTLRRHGGNVCDPAVQLERGLFRVILGVVLIIETFNFGRRASFMNYDRGNATPGSRHIVVCLTVVSPTAELLLSPSVCYFNFFAS
jgi:hypothetical protein